jgi:hypothetical protein
MKNSLNALAKEFVRNMETILREQIRREILFAIEHPSQAKMRHEAKAKARRHKRSTEEVDQLATHLFHRVIEAPGSTIERLSTLTHRSPKDLRLPMIRLRDAGEVRKYGKARSTRYYPVRS